MTTSSTAKDKQRRTDFVNRPSSNTVTKNKSFGSRPTQQSIYTQSQTPVAKLGKKIAGASRLSTATNANSKVLRNSTGHKQAS